MDEQKTEAYEAPAISDIASVHELTLMPQKKNKSKADGNGHGHPVHTS